MGNKFRTGIAVQKILSYEKISDTRVGAQCAFIGRKEQRAAPWEHSVRLLEEKSSERLRGSTVCVYWKKRAASSSVGAQCAFIGRKEQRAAPWEHSVRLLEEKSSERLHGTVDTVIPEINAWLK